MTNAPHVLRPRLRETLDAGRIGAWEFDAVAGLQYLDRCAATLLDLPAGEARRGVPFRRVKSKIHAADRIIGDDGGLLISVRDGLFTHICRYRSAGGTERQAILHGSIETGAAGEVISSGGVIVDITERSACIPGLQPAPRRGEEPAWQLDRAIEAASSAHRAIRRLGPAARPSLLHLTELLLHELGTQLAQQRAR